MNEEQMMMVPPDDIMSLRAGVMIALAQAVDQTRDENAANMLLMAMDALLYTINPPRGNVQEVKH